YNNVQKKSNSTQEKLDFLYGYFFWIGDKVSSSPCATIVLNITWAFACKLMKDANPIKINGDPRNTEIIIILNMLSPCIDDAESNRFGIENGMLTMTIKLPTPSALAAVANITPLFLFSIKYKKAPKIIINIPTILPTLVTVSPISAKGIFSHPIFNISFLFLSSDFLNCPRNYT